MISDLERRDDIIEELLNMIAGMLSSRSDEELEVLQRLMRSGQHMALDGLRSEDNSVLLYLNPTSSKEAAVAALRQLLEWVEDNWEEMKLQMAPGFPVYDRPTKAGLPN